MRSLLIRQSVAAATLATLVLAAVVFLPGGLATALLRAVDADAEADFIAAVNASRADEGLPALELAPDLVNVARDHSAVMSDDQRLHHNPQLGNDVQNWRRVAENVGVGGSVASLHRAFMNSPGHRKNILDDRVTQIGIGVQVHNGRIWVTKVFRLRMDPSETPSASSAPAPAPEPAPAPAQTQTQTSVDGSTPLWGDWDGDGDATPGRFKDGVFELSNETDGGGTITVIAYGKKGDKPLVGDWDGDGDDTVGVVRGNQFILRNDYRSGAQDIVLAYGNSSDTPVAGDWDGDGIDTIGVVRGNLFILRNEYRKGAKDVVMAYGEATDTPVVGDWDGDGTDTLGVVRGNLWILRNEYVRGAKDIVMAYGKPGDQKMVGDYNGDGRDTLGIVRNDEWVLRYEYRRGADITLRY